MKKLFFVPILLIFICFSCKKRNIQQNCCKANYIYEKVDSSGLCVPNIFTPNGDNINDILVVRCLNISSIHVMIHDKIEFFDLDKDKIIFESTGMNNNWDGKYNGKIKEGHYKITIDAVTTNGKNIHAESEVAIIINPSKYCLKHLTNCVFGDQLDPKYGLIYNTMEVFSSSCK